MNNQVNGTREEQTEELKFEDHAGIIFVIPHQENR
tara:strand:+ start:8142 stop:8246 length:105 start_codon:yes stop_codon:yes gene_type:complete